MPRLLAGHLTAYCLIWLCWAVGSPIVAEVARQPLQPQTICPALQIWHGVGSDLKPFVGVRDLCAL